MFYTKQNEDEDQMCKFVKVILECAKGNINKHAVQAGVRQVRDQVG